MEEIDFIIEEENLSDLLIKEERESAPVSAFNDDENIQNQSNLIVSNTVGSNAHIEPGDTAEALEVASYKFTMLSMTPNFEFLDSKNAIGALGYNRPDITARSRSVEINRDDSLTFIEVESAPVVIEPFYFFTAIAANVGTSTFGDDDDSVVNELYRVDLTEGVEYSISLRGRETGDVTLPDPIIGDVFDNSGAIVSSGNDDSGFFHDSLLFFTPGATGTYFFELGDYGTRTGSFIADINILGVRSSDTAASNVLNGTSDTDHIDGNDGNDTISGLDGLDFLDGGRGEDIINGGAGSDILLGGSEEDTFIFDSTDGVDQIVDEGGSSDIFDVSGLLSGYVMGVSDISDFIQIRDDGSDTVLSVDVDGSVGGAFFIDFARIQGKIGLDFEGDVNNTDAEHVKFAITGDGANTTATAISLSLNTNVSGISHGAGDADFYSVSLTNGVEYAISLRGSVTSGETISDPLIGGVYDSGGLQQSSGDDDGGISRESLLFFTADSTGTHFFEFGGFGSSTGTYTAQITLAGSKINGTSSDDVINTGTANTDFIDGKNGNDTLFGYGGIDHLEGGNDDDILNGGTGADILYGGNGDDTFIFDSLDAIDTVSDFNLSDDFLDISDILNTHYDHTTDLLSDFVQITDDGTHSTLLIDQDGGADSFVAVAHILDITGLDPMALEGTTLLTF